MFCKKHGDIDNRTMSFSFPIAPHVMVKGKTIPLPELNYDKGKDFCLECIQELLEREIGTASKTKPKPKIPEIKSRLQRFCEWMIGKTDSRLA